MTTVFSKPLGDEVKELSDKIANLNGGIDLGDLATVSAIETALDSKLTGMSEYEVIVVQFRYTGSTTGAIIGGKRYSCRLIKGGGSNYANAELRGNSGTGEDINGYRGSTGWVWTSFSDQLAKKVTLFDLDTLPANSSKAFTVGTNTRAVLMTIGGGTSKSMFLVSSTSTAYVTILEVAKDSTISITSSTGSLTLSNSGTQNPRTYAFIFAGSISASVS